MIKSFEAARLNRDVEKLHQKVLEVPPQALTSSLVALSLAVITAIDHDNIGKDSIIEILNNDPPLDSESSLANITAAADIASLVIDQAIKNPITS